MKTPHFYTENPYTKEKIQDYGYFSDDEIEKLLSQSQSSQEVWQKISLPERIRFLKLMQDSMRTQRLALAEKITSEMGKIKKEAEAEVDKCIAAFDFAFENASSFLHSEEAVFSKHQYIIEKQALGVLFLIMPWNFPLWQVIRVALPTLLAGNRILLKHANITQGCSQMLSNLFSQHLPPGVFQNLVIDHSQAAKIIADPRVAAVSLTGSTRAGREVAAIAGRHLKKTVMELGGSDPYLVFADADLNLAVDACFRSRHLNAGQSCISAKRFIIEEGAFEEFVEAYLKQMMSLKMGDPRNESTTLAPLAQTRQVELTRQQIKSLHSFGGQCLGKLKEPHKDSAFIEPQVWKMPSMNGLEELELFAPVALFFKATNEDEMIKIANQSRYGLGAAVFSKDRERAMKAARRIESGFCAINDFVKSDPHVPFGGVKESGYGRELGREGYLEFVNVRTLGGIFA